MRDVTVSPGSGPGQAVGGTLKVFVTNPVKSGTRFQVRGIVTNRVSQPISVNLLFVTPTDSTRPSIPVSCRGDVPPDVEFGVAAAPWPA